MSSNQRFVWADSLKGLLILLVVLGHAIQVALGETCESSHLWNLIYSFHMPAFMAISGFLAFRPDRLYLGGKSLFTTLQRRFRQLIMPFIIWTVLLFIIKNTGDESNTPILNYILYPDKGLWFLWVLFFINVFFLFGRRMAAVLKINEVYIILSICCLFVGIMVLFEPRLFGFQFIAYYFLFYTLGYYLHKYDNVLITKKVFVLLLLGLVWFILAWFWKMHDLPLWLSAVPLPASLTQYAYRFIVASIAVYVLLSASPLVLNSNKLFNRPFIYLGTISLGVYTTHFLMIGRIVRFFSSLLSNRPLIILCSSLLALLISTLFVWCLSKCRITRCLMLGKIES